jgi:octaprenyl-diphosphate synthase
MQPATARDTLLRVASGHRLPRVQDLLRSAGDGLCVDLAGVERDLLALTAGDATGTSRSIRHLMEAGGKRIRPVFCLLAARAFPPVEPPAIARRLACVAEVVHGATLLHDDVIDQGETRRDRPTARLIFGNSASILGGDLLLVEALDAVEASAIPQLRRSLIEMLRRLVTAEALQLEARGRVQDAEGYLAVVDGKTSSLFEWTLEAGARSAGASDEQVEGLRGFGREVGRAFQLLDDLLDLARDSATVGKGVLQDLASGTTTWPLLLSLEGRPELAARLTDSARGPQDPTLVTDLLAAVADSGAVPRTRSRITDHTRAAVNQLAPLPASPARDALTEAAFTLARRAR